MRANRKKPLLAHFWIVAIVAVAILAGTPASMAWLMVLLQASVLLLYLWRAQPYARAQRVHETRR